MIELQRSVENCYKQLTLNRMDVSDLLVNFEILGTKLITFIVVETGPRVLRSCGFVEGESKVGFTE